MGAAGFAKESERERHENCGGNWGGGERAPSSTPSFGDGQNKHENLRNSRETTLLLRVEFWPPPITIQNGGQTDFGLTYCRMYGEPLAQTAEKEDGMPSKAMDAEPPQFGKKLLKNWHGDSDVFFWDRARTPWSGGPTINTAFSCKGVEFVLHTEKREMSGHTFVVIKW